VIDPFGDDPIVVTGSHNLSGSASSKNDENLIIIRNSPGLARAYAVHCMTIYQHYRWPAYQDEVSKNKSSDDGFLDKTPGWQAKAQTPDTLNALKFWLG
jgi:phosphatidylserine/phosphatidylglycerophosphate/cardiolipin synthase-like enzyme